MRTWVALKSAMKGSRSWERVERAERADRARRARPSISGRSQRISLYDTSSSLDHNHGILPGKNSAYLLILAIPSPPVPLKILILQ